MAWTNEEFEEMRADRVRYCEQIATLEAGRPTVTHSELGVVQNETKQDIARHQRNIEEIDAIFSELGIENDA